MKRSIQVLKNQEALKMENLPEASTLGSESVFSKDPNFKAELDYDGYDEIEESDNDEYSSDVEGKREDRTKELKFKDRQENDSILVEENVLNKQDNQKR